jgi:DUF4097 and DUF4098 domain-containing protein YvlB
MRYQATMKSQSVISPILAGCIIAAAVCLSALPAAASAEGSFQRALQTTGPVSLEVSTGSGRVQVRKGGSSQVEVTGRIKVTDWFGGNAEEKVKRLEANPPIQQRGNDISIGHIEDADLRHNVSISYEVVVPAETQLRVHSGSGDQSVEGIRGPLEMEAGSGALKISEIGDRVLAGTGSGDIEIDGVRGNVHAKTGSGSIKATRIAGGFQADSGSGHVLFEQSAPGSVRVDTGSGGMELRGLRGSLDAKAGSGTIEAEGSPTGAWSLHTGSGGVRLKLPSAASFDLDAHTSSGSIMVQPPHSVQGSIARHQIRGRVGSGGVPVEVETGAGDIEIE